MFRRNLRIFRKISPSEILFGANKKEAQKREGEQHTTQGWNQDLGNPNLASKAHAGLFPESPESTPACLAGDPAGLDQNTGEEGGGATHHT